MKMKYLIVFCAAGFLFSQAVLAANLNQNSLESCKGDVCVYNLNSATETTPASIATSPDITLSQTNPSATITLASNPTTGYSWTATSYDHSLLTLSHKYVRSKPELIGSGGNDVWTITATQKALNAPSQTATINFGYLRPWEKDKAPANTKQVTVQIN